MFEKIAVWFATFDISPNVEASLDIATAISIITAAFYFIYNQRKENKKQRDENLESAKRLKKERISESGARVIIEEIRTTSEHFKTIIKESSDVDAYSRLYLRDSGEDDDSFIKRSSKNITEEKIRDILRALKEFRENLDDAIEDSYQQRYVLAPVIDALIENDKDEIYSKRLTTSSDNLADNHNKLSIILAYLTEVFELFLILKGKSTEEISKLINEKNNEGLSEIETKTYSIILNDYYSQFDSGILEGSSTLQEKANCLLNILTNDESRTSFINNIFVYYRVLSGNIRYIFKEKLCDLSGVYAYILKDESDTKEISDFVKGYESKFDLKFDLKRIIR